jgi:type I restriction enzyme S subunit
MDSENDELPDGWTVSTVGELGQVQLGKMLDRAKNQGSPVSYLRNISVRWFDFALEDLKSVRVSDEELARFSVEDGDLFICEGGEPGRCAVWRNGSNTMVYQKALHRFRTKGAILPVLLMYRLRQEAEIGRLHEWFSGSTIKHLTRENFVKFEVPVPPLAEQKRIADKLEAVLGRVEACRARLDRVPALLKRFRQSVLAAATSGKLTEEWRIENSVREEWSDSEIQSVASVGTGSTPTRANSKYFASTGTPWITSAATSQVLVTQAEEFVTASAIAAHRLKKFPIGTLLVAMYGEGKTRGQVTELGIEATINQACAAVVVNEAKALKRFVKFALEANYFQMRELAEGGNQPNLNLSKIKGFPLRLPALPEQQEIVRRVEALFAFADRIEARLATARKTVERLTPATLAKAFRGELVPQDPNDEPAAALLERLHAQTDPATAKSKRGRRAKSTSA